MTIVSFDILDRSIPRKYINLFVKLEIFRLFCGSPRLNISFSFAVCH